MSGELINNVRKLNRLSKLYDVVSVNGKPYTISRVRNLYQHVLDDLQNKYTITMLDSHNYQSLFGTDTKIASLLEEKERAVKAGQYEFAAQLRDIEKRVLSLKLARMGFETNENFIIIGDGIYQLPG